jgi:hypothetical protein
MLFLIPWEGPSGIRCLAPFLCKYTRNAPGMSGARYV